MTRETPMPSEFNAAYSRTPWEELEWIEHSTEKQSDCSRDELHHHSLRPSTGQRSMRICKIASFVNVDGSLQCAQASAGVHSTRRSYGIYLVPVKWLKAHEQCCYERYIEVFLETLEAMGYKWPIIVDCSSGVILDGHHRFQVALALHLKVIPAILVDYLSDDTIQVVPWKASSAKTKRHDDSHCNQESLPEAREDHYHERTYRSRVMDIKTNLARSEEIDEINVEHPCAVESCPPAWLPAWDLREKQYGSVSSVYPHAPTNRCTENNGTEEPTPESRNNAHDEVIQSTSGSSRRNTKRFPLKEESCLLENFLTQLIQPRMNNFFVNPPQYFSEPPIPLKRSWSETMECSSRPPRRDHPSFSSIERFSLSQQHLYYYTHKTNVVENPLVIDKQQVIKVGLSNMLFPPKTTRHLFNTTISSQTSDFPLRVLLKRT